MISLDLTKSSEVRKAGDRPNYQPLLWLEGQIPALILLPTLTSFHGQ